MSSVAQTAGSVRILGVRIDDITMDETIAAIEAMIERGGHHQIITANPEHLVAARSQRPFRATLEAADIATADGAGLLHAARWQGRPLRERVTGVDLTERIAAESARRAGSGRPWRLFLLGAG
ncbi:MAG TPA: WecB/TagA/CpsF family glycosyltransferase, partial [Herpetosiphonaceae bacterium]